jgi:uncharacterized membrane protein YgcG
MMAIFSITVFAFEIPKKPVPNRFVNDYIGMLTADQVKTLEDKLVDFDQKTSIQIVIVILDDLDGEEPSVVATDIGESWGVGQKELDNGIVFLIVKYNQNAIEKLFTDKRGDCWIAPGYGLEEYITDYDATNISKSEFIPYAKEDKYYEGITNTINYITKDLGEVGWQQRVELTAKRKAESAENLRKVGNGFLIFFIFAIIVGLCIWLYIKARKAYKKAQEIIKQRKSLKETMLAEAERFKNLFGKIILYNSSDYPAWAKTCHDKIMKSIRDRIEPAANKERETFLAVFGDDLEPMRKSLNHFEELTSELAGLVTKLEAIPKEIKEYKEGAPNKLQTAEEKLQEFAMSINVLKDKGFKLTSFEKEFGDFKTSLSQTNEKVNSDEDKSKEVFLESIGIYEGIEGTMQLMNECLYNREVASKTIVSLNAQIESLPTQKESAQKVLDQIKAENPKQNWEDVENAFESITSLLLFCKEKIADAEVKKNGMYIQDFNSVKALVDKANEKMEKILNIFQNIHNRKDEIAKAKKSYHSLLQSAEQKISSARNKCSESDVENEARRKLTDAIDNLTKAKSSASGDLIDWLAVIALISLALSLATKSYQLAEDDIEEAERRRKKKEEEEEEEARRRRNSYSSSSSSYSSGSSYSSSGSSFGGSSFGGGSFGGGGGGGSW